MSSNQQQPSTALTEMAHTIDANRRAVFGVAPAGVPPLRILTMDGGGIRGILLCVWLKVLEQITGRRIGQLFDFIVGTSTGGILALALTRPAEQGGPLSADECMDLYAKRGGEIFSTSLAQKAWNVFGLKHSKYSANGIEKVLKDVFGDAEQSAHTPPAEVVAYDAFNHQPCTLINGLSWENARATSAGPTYFPPVEIDGDTYIDGGVYANNPTLMALAAASSQFNARPEHCVVLSLGTGRNEKPFTYEQTKDWGELQWVSPLIDIMMNASQDSVDWQAREILPPGQYMRLNFDLPPEHAEMDDVSANNIAFLKSQSVALPTADVSALDRFAAKWLARSASDTPTPSLSAPHAA